MNRKKTDDTDNTKTIDEWFFYEILHNILIDVGVFYRRKILKFILMEITNNFFNLKSF